MTETQSLVLDLTQVPYSCAGSYLTVSLRQPGNVLLLRTIRGDRETDLIFRLEPTRAGEPVPFAVDARPHRIRLSAADGMIDLCFGAPNQIRAHGTSDLGLRLTPLGGSVSPQPYDREGRWWVNAWPARMTFLLTPVTGHLVVEDAPSAVSSDPAPADFLPENGEFEALIEEFLTERTPILPTVPFEQVSSSAPEFEAFVQSQPPVPVALKPAADLMAYVQWSCLVAPEGHFRRPAMLMSKNFMAHVWSWDHCFNALALMAHDPSLAWDQFLIPFDHQDTAGALPDCVNDKLIIRNFTKPPIHGWTLRGLLAHDRDGFLTDDRLGTIYEPMARWTRWWLTFRDQDGDGMPQYNHGNDSGWDNSTAFDIGYPVEGPDLAAYLVIQMDVLADLARRLGRIEEGVQWSGEADALLGRLMVHSWRGDRFIAPRSESHLSVPPDAGDSLLPFLPLVLGGRLPSEAREPLITGLLTPGRFLTDFGLATESLSSPHYTPDGYWRGPIWAPPMLLIADGLHRLGEEAAARTIAERFCRAVARSGSAENFNARTGDGLRDRAYTWTASVFLILAREYLDHATFTL